MAATNPFLPVSLRCAGCGGGVRGSYITALDRQWHPEHFVCGACSTPLHTGFYERDGKPYCEADYVQLFVPRCSICREPLRSRYLTNWWGERCCPAHRQELPACQTCGRLISRNTGGGRR